MTREEWGRRVLAVALRQLSVRLSGRLRCLQCRIRQRGEWWSVILECSNRSGNNRSAGPRAVVEAGKPPLVGCAAVRVKTQWLPGDPRLSRQLKLAAANAVGELAEAGDLGLGVFDRRGNGAGATDMNNPG